MAETLEYASSLPLEQRRDAIHLAQALWQVINWEGRRAGPGLLGVVVAFRMLWAYSKKAEAEVGEDPVQCFEALNDLCQKGEVRLLDDPAGGRFVHNAHEVRQ